MAANYNRVILMGNLTRDPEIQYVSSGTARVRFGLAVNRVYTDRQTGEKKQDTCFVNITAWGRTAEICQEYLRKGSPVFLEGRLSYYAWETEQGEKRSSLEVIAESVQLLPSARAEGAVDQEGVAPTEAVPAEDDIPF